MQRSSLDILLFLSSMGPTIKIRIPITTHKANEKIDGITAYFAISKTILKTIPDNTVQLQNLSKCTPPANALSNEKKVKNRIPYLNIPSKNDIHNAITVLIATSIAISNPNLHTS